MGAAMRLELTIDSYFHQVDSTDPEILGKWMVEIFGRVQWTPSTFIQVRAQPSYIPGAPGGMDWIADTRIIGQATRVKSPREVVEALSAWVDEWERLHEHADT